MVGWGRHDETQPLMNDSNLHHNDRDRDAMSPDDEPAPVGAGHPDAPLETITSSTKNRTSTTTTAGPLPQDTDTDTTVQRSSSPLEVGLESSTGDDDSGIPTPRFLADERGRRSRRRLTRWIPYSVRRVGRAIAKWSRGPPTPRRFRIRPLLPQVQEYPLRFSSELLPKLRWAPPIWLLLALYFSVWLVTYVLVKRQGTLASEIAGWGQPQPIGCGDTYWRPDNACGVDGNDCRPFNNSGFAFRCNGNCESYHVLNPRAVGDQEVIYQPFVVGGSDEEGEEAYYRGDSFICGAAIHAGIISNAAGGCGVVELIGEQDAFVGSDRNGIPSVSFDSHFPLSFRFLPDVHCSARDTRWELLAISAVFTGVLSLLTNSPALFFFPSFVGIFWTVGTALDTPPHRSLAHLFSIVLGRFLPAMFCAWVMYDRMGIRRTLAGLTAQVEKTILWLGACWVGGLDNYTLSFIPINRLSGHDLEQQPGAKAALAIIIIVLLAVIASQVWFFQQEARLLRYLKLYALLVGGIVISLLLPELELRLHHYILALLLLPGTSIQTRPSLLYQGLLVGLFINGIARWGFDPVLQTAADLQGDAQLGTELPTISTPVIDLASTGGGLSNITFSWSPPTEAQFDGISILVNDVERFRSFAEDSVRQQEGQDGDVFVWSREADLGRPEYFRFAYMDGSDTGDYTKAGVWTAEGEWVAMKPGPSRVKRAEGLTSRDSEQHIGVKGRRRR
ncbi:hypothetical protein ACRE_080060 [Hapsidospora chrysogenum ATCC 11550]|uniref:LCCL domain-containing protein n=1 Tax=Hapsidospora chrysogenum (strain ATCC 11550 / CBS 779.69 / DSM 880 / IAM 14645 / JCM 23072 / IMI 49137) TaxID=857340 RepID=A0A086SW15_HAPC1|nr:hypothetical protein ACRE_080060 [Hapsidospora chrysogenum ATCC 11550]